MSAKTTRLIYNEFEDVLSGIGCCEGAFSVQIKDGSQNNTCKGGLKDYAIFDCSDSISVYHMSV